MVKKSTLIFQKPQIVSGSCISCFLNFGIFFFTQNSPTPLNVSSLVVGYRLKIVSRCVFIAIHQKETSRKILRLFKFAGNFKPKPDKSLGRLYPDHVANIGLTTTWIFPLAKPFKGINCFNLILILSSHYSKTENSL